MTDDNLILLLTNKKNYLEKNKNYLSYFPLNPLDNNPNNIKAVQYKIPEREQIYKRYDFCESLYNEMIKEFSEKLNHIHKENYSIRAWDLMIGSWLKGYIQFSYKNYLNLSSIISNYKINTAFISDYKKYDFTIPGTASFGLAKVDVDWNLCFCSKLFEYFYSEKIKINYHTPSYFKLKNKHLSFENNRLFFRLLSSFSKIFRTNNEAFISRTYLPFKEEKKLEMYFKQIPSFYSKPKISPERVNIDLRKMLTYQTDSKNLSIENFVKINLKNFIPLFAIENFKIIKKISKSRVFPQNPKFIFTSSLYSMDEFFKLYAASQIMKNKPYYIGQHGNNYFSKIHTNYLSELKHCDSFFSWGFQKEPKIKKFFNFKILNKQVSHDKNGKLLIILNNPESDIIHDLAFNPQEFLKDILDILSVIKNLNKDIKNKTILRLNMSFYKKILGIKYIKFFENLEVSIDNGKKNINKLIKEARLCLFTYDSTGFLENTLNDIPSIFICNKDFINCINDDFREKYNNLINAKIMFNDSMPLINHINSNWEEISSWWSKPEIRKTINDFNQNFNLKPFNGCLKYLKENLKFKNNVS